MCLVNEKRLHNDKHGLSCSPTHANSTLTLQVVVIIITRHIHNKQPTSLHVSCFLCLLPLIFANYLFLSMLKFVLRLHLHHAHAQHSLSLKHNGGANYQKLCFARFPHGLEVANKISAATVAEGEGRDTNRQTHKNIRTQ